MFDVRSFFAALRRRPGPASAYERGLAALDAGRPDDALAQFQEALEAATDLVARAAAHNKCGVAFVALARPNDALDAFGQALACDPRCAAALTNVGNLLFEGGHVLDAVDYYEAAIRADEGYPVAHRNIGVAFKRLGRRAEAVRALRSAARLEGRRPPERG